MLEWVRFVAPDLRLRHGETLRIIEETGEPVLGSVCRFTIGGKIVEGSAEGEGARDKIVEIAYRYVRDALGRPLRKAIRSRLLESQIVAAAYAGNSSLAETLTRQLVTENEGIAPAPKETRFEPIAPARARPPFAPPAEQRAAPPEAFGRRW